MSIDGVARGIENVEGIACAQEDVALAAAGHLGDEDELPAL